MRTILTGDDVDLAYQSGKKEIYVQPDDIITSIAKEKAEKHGIRFVSHEGIHPAEPKPPHEMSRAPAGKPGTFIPAYLSQQREGLVAEGTRQVPPYDMDYWRKQFPLLRTHIHVANCSQAPQSTFTRQAALEYLDNWDRMGMDWDRWMEEIHFAKEEFARIINADADDIAIGTSVSEMTSAVASALPLNAGRKKVVVTDAEFPTVGLIWQAHQKYGFKVQFLPLKNGIIDVNDYDRYVDEDTIITSACDTYYYNGFRQDLKSVIARIHAKGSLAFVDAYQAAGTHPIDVKDLDVDFLATGNLKYLLGVPGIAFMYVKRDLVEYLHPSFTGWFGQEKPFAFDIHNFVYAPDARRFDSGTPPVPTAYIARAGMNIINTVGVEKIHQWTNVVSEHCMKGALDRGLDLVSPTDIRMKAPNTAIRVPGDSHDFELALRKDNIIASARGDAVRIAAHFFTTLEDIDYILDCFLKHLNPK